MMCPCSGLLLTCQLEAEEVALKAWEEAPGRGGVGGSWAHFTPLRASCILLRRTSRTHTQAQKRGGAGSRGRRTRTEALGLPGPACEDDGRGGNEPMEVHGGVEGRVVVKEGLSQEGDAGCGTW